MNLGIVLVTVGLVVQLAMISYYLGDIAKALTKLAEIQRDRLHNERYGNEK